MITMSRVTITAIAVLLLAGCARPGQAANATPQSGERVWQSDGYGWIYALDGDELKIYETTSISCLPSRTLHQIGQPDPDGPRQFGRNGVVSQTLRASTSGPATAHQVGTAADVELRPLPTLPAQCTQPTSDDPVTTFDIFWTTFAENYNSFGRKHIDWLAVRDRYRPMVNEDTGSHALFRILRQMIAPLGDVHTTVDASHGREFDGLRPGTPDLSDHAALAAVDDHLSALGATNRLSFARGHLVYADLPGGRGYLRITSFENFDADDDSYQASSAVLGQALDQIFTAGRASGLRKLIVDVRLNDGGDDALGLQVAARLTDVPYLAFSKAPRNDPTNPGRHARAQAVRVVPAKAPHYTGPVDVLTSSLTISAGETFVEALMGRNPAPARIGGPTQGVFADDMTRKLPNGWTFTLGNEDYIASDGHNYEGIGLPPTRPVPPFPPDSTAGPDLALDAAQ
jgi:hypothetical protein